MEGKLGEVTSEHVYTHIYYTYTHIYYTYTHIYYTYILHIYTYIVCVAFPLSVQSV